MDRLIKKYGLSDSCDFVKYFRTFSLLKDWELYPEDYTYNLMDGTPYTELTILAILPANRKLIFHFRTNGSYSYLKVP